MTASAFSVAATVTGAFIGAGFVSGQELWQFFGKWGKLGIPGFIIAMSGMMLLSFFTLRFVSKTGKNSFAGIVSPSGNRTVKALVTVFELVFYICLYIIMIAGTETLISDYLPIDRLLIGALFAVAVTVISLVGISGIMKVFSAVVPLLTLLTVAIAIAVIGSGGIVVPTSSTSDSPVGWLVSAFVYISYNFFAGIGVLSSLGTIVKSGKRTARAVTLSALFLTLLGLSVILSVFTAATSNAEMPMLEAAKTIHSSVGIIYGIFLVLAMFGASIASLFPIVKSLWRMLGGKKTAVTALTVLVSALSVALSLFGFSDLIGTIYPIFGYIGFLIIIVIIFNFVKEK